MAAGKLTAIAVTRQTKPGTYGDGGGLYLKVSEGGKSWLFRFKLHGKATWMGLGSVADYTLAEAREKARTCRRMVAEGLNPIDQRREAQEAAREAQGQTFQSVAERYIAAHKAEWRNAKHAAQWESTLALYAYPHFGSRPVQSVAVSHVLAALEPIWIEKPETASRVRGRIEAVLDYATARKLRSGENPARWRGNLDHLLPRRSKVARVKHHAAAPYTGIAGLMVKLAESNGTAALCLRFAILTAARSGEARGATWREIDMDAGIWTVPGERMKAGREHRVPLSAPALAILREMAALGSGMDRLVFEGGRRGRPLSDVAVSKALRAAGGDGFTVHGMRSSFRQWVAEQTAYPGEVGEAALAHTNADKVEAAYQRSDLFEKRRRLMDEWAAYATTPAAARGEVVKIGRARA
ncbi:tyrosine-type recombinase/integrase [Acidocella facilis]|uniref:tyrosine-type recombinase/integrase n=1 Tax=Acidocella facilis TaxID=525 RepID=UPI001F3B4132|nr:integrase arm-type DNA-binding domain-containing protein [Acidocella facilis]